MRHKHGMRRSKEYSSWLNIRLRCLDENHHNYEYYGGRGITIAPEFINDFTAFYNEIGPVPDNSNKWTVDRINNDEGYVKGNIKWELMNKQSRNRRKVSSNSSGVTGVGWLDKGGNKGTSAYAVCSVFDECLCKYVKKYKYFSVNKYGLLPAFAMAVAHRRLMIDKLNTMGYGYSEQHGE